MKQIGIIAAAMAMCLAGTTGLMAKTQPIGGARVIVNSVMGKIESKSIPVNKGDAIFENELISTGDKARAEFYFLDRTRLTLGENSDIRLDSYVYNPRRKTGRIVLNSLKGAFRFVSGTARKSAYVVKTPLATIGVRGTVIDGYMSADRLFSVFLLQSGAMTVCSTARCQPVGRPGTFVVVKSDGTISKPKQWRGRIPGITFTSRFPAPGGRFYVDPQQFFSPGEAMQGDGGASPSGGGGYGGGSGTGGTSGY